MDDAVDTDERIEDDGRTVVRPVVTIEAQSPDPAPGSLPASETGPHTVLRSEDDELARTQLRGAVGTLIAPDGLDSTTGARSTTGTQGLVPTLPDRERVSGRSRLGRPWRSVWERLWCWPSAWP